MNLTRRSVLALGGAAALAACSKGESGGTAATVDKTSGPTVEVQMVVMGDKPTNGRLEKMLDKLNPLLKQKVNATLTFRHIEWADWQTQYNVAMLSGDTKMDLITTATDWLFAWENAKKGAFLPLTEDMLKANAPMTWEKVNAKGDWDLCKLNDGSIYFIPEDEYTQYTNHGFFYRGDWAKQAGFADGNITKFEDFTQYFEWIKKNKPKVYGWDVAGSLDAALTGYIQGHTDFQTIQQISAGNYYPYQTTKADPYKITSYYMEGDAFLQACELTKKWNEIGVWREDALNYSGVTRDQFYAGLSGVDQHHTQTFIGGIVYNMNTKQPGSDPRMFYWGQENGNVFKDIKTHGAMAVSANTKHPEKALQVYDTLRNDKECYMLLTAGIEGSDYVVKDGVLDFPASYDPSKDGLGSNFWAGRRDEFELPRKMDAPNKKDIYAALDKVATDYPYSTLIFNKDAIDPSLAAMGGVLSQYIPQLQYGKMADPEKAVKEMRDKLRTAGYDLVRESLQADMDKWKQEKGLK